MDYFIKNTIASKLESISDEQWTIISKRCKKALGSKLLGKTEFGAHSEKTLGTPAVDYYFKESITKIFGFEWEWKFEKYSIEEQVLRISGSLISRQVESYKGNKNSISETELDENLNYDVFDEVYDDNIDNILNCIEMITESDIDLSMYWLSIKEGLKPKEISQTLEKPIKQVYKLNEKLIYQAKTKCLNR